MTDAYASCHNHPFLLLSFSRMPTTTTKKPVLARVPASAPVSPATVRCNVGNRNVSPVTPQRITRAPFFTNQGHSPMAPARHVSAPYTPLTSRSYGSPDGSILATPSSGSSLKRLNLGLSPGPGFERYKERSLADIAENWRARACENGIRVSGPGEDPHYADDEGRCMRVIELFRNIDPSCEASDHTTSDIDATDLFVTRDCTHERLCR